MRTPRASAATLVLLAACGRPSPSAAEAEAVATASSPAAGADSGPAAPQLTGAPFPKPTVDMVGEVRFTRDGSRLLALDRSVTVYDFDDGTGTLTEAGWFGFEVDRSPPASTSDLAVLEAWLADHESIEAFDLSADGRFVVGGGGRTGRLAIWELTPGAAAPARRVAELAAPLREVEVVAFAHGDSRVLAGGRTPDERSTAAEDTRLALLAFDPQAKPPLTPLASVPAGGRLGALAVAPDGELAATVGSNELLRLLELGDDGNELSVALELELDAAAESVRFAPDGRRLITVGVDQLVQVWEVGRGPAALTRLHALRHHRGATRRVEVAPDGRWMVAASDDAEVSFWPLAGLVADAVPRPIVIRSGEAEVTYGLAIHPRSPWLVTSGDAIRVWRLNRDALATGAASTPRSAGAPRALPWTGPPALLVAFDADGSLLTVDAAGAIARWDLGVDPARAQLLRPGDAVPAEDFGPVRAATLVGDRVLLSTPTDTISFALPGVAASVGQCSITAGPASTATLWRSASGGPEAVAELEAGAPAVRAVAIVSALAITSAQDGARTTLRVHAIDPSTCAPTGAPAVGVFAPPTPFGDAAHTGGNPDGQDTPIVLAPAPDGRWLLSGSRDGGSATLWKVEGGTITPHATLAGHRYGVSAIAFSPDGTRAVTAGSEGATLLWRFDPATGVADELGDLPPGPPPAGFAESVAWAPDGRTVCVGGGHFHEGRVWCHDLATANDSVERAQPPR